MWKELLPGLRINIFLTLTLGVVYPLAVCELAWVPPGDDGAAIPLPSRLHVAPTVGFVGWFGPRGLASIVFAVIVVEESSLPHETLIVHDDSRSSTTICAGRDGASYVSSTRGNGMLTRSFFSAA